MSSAPEQRRAPSLDDVYQRILGALQGLRFGTVELQVHDFRIVRITRTEQVRLEPPQEPKART